MTLLVVTAVHCKLPPKHLGPHQFSTHWHAGCCNAMQGARWRERRPCPGCSYVAIRRVYPGISDPKLELVSECSLCVLRNRIAQHQRTLVRMQRELDELTAKRAERLKRKRGGA